MKNITSHAPSDRSVYTSSFWLTYLSNFSLMITVSIMFRYSDFITVLGGNEFHLGWIVGIGTTGSVTFRILQGVCIDRYGAGRVWLFSVVMVVLSLLAHLFINRLDTPWVFLARMFFATSVAGFFGSSITFISLRAPAGRTAEMIGVLGSSGFIGMAIGPTIADWLFVDEVSRTQVNKMFWAAIFVSMFSTLAVYVVTSREPRIATRLQRKRPPTWWLLRRYQPGRVLWASFAMGLGITMPFTFARPFAAEIGVEGIRSFFLVYAITAFGFRVTTRSLPDRWGVRPTVILGISCSAASMLAYLCSMGPWTILLPAFFGGMAHAFLFPAAVAGGSLAFPHRYRGLATNLMLAMFDLGALVGQPAIGSLLRLARYLELPAYPLTFSFLALSMGIAAVYYAAEPDRRLLPRHVRSQPSRLEALPTS